MLGLMCPQHRCADSVEVRLTSAGRGEIYAALLELLPTLDIFLQQLVEGLKQAGPCAKAGLRRVSAEGQRDDALTTAVGQI